MTTWVEDAAGLLSRVEALRGRAVDSREVRLAAREYALACTHLEDAIMRFNRGQAREGGLFEVGDVEAVRAAVVRGVGG